MALYTAEARAFDDLVLSPQEAQALDILRRAMLGAPLVQISGPRGVGRRHIARALGASLARETLELDGTQLQPKGDFNPILAQVALRQAALIVWVRPELSQRDRGRLVDLLQRLKSLCVALIVVTDEVTASPIEVEHQLQLRRPAINERKRLWKKALTRRARLGLELDGLTAGFALTGEQIHRNRPPPEPGNSSSAKAAARSQRALGMAGSGGARKRSAMTWLLWPSRLKRRSV